MLSQYDGSRGLTHQVELKQKLVYQNSSSVFIKFSFITALEKLISSITSAGMQIDDVQLILMIYKQILK